MGTPGYRRHAGTLTGSDAYATMSVSSVLDVQYRRVCIKRYLPKVSSAVLLLFVESISMYIAFVEPTTSSTAGS